MLYFVLNPQVYLLSKSLSINNLSIIVNKIKKNKQNIFKIELCKEINNFKHEVKVRSTSYEKPCNKFSEFFDRLNCFYRHF